MSDVLLAIETSCDETAAAVVSRRDDGSIVVRSSVVASQIERHARFGGVVPELASRAHVEVITDVVAAALDEASVGADALTAVGATAGPGLAGALVVGMAAAKALAIAHDLDFVAVNHLEGHLYAPFIEAPTMTPPMVVLLVSGGHTMLIDMREHLQFRLLGQTVDDAAGEAFDKVARFLGLGYPGGPEIDRLAATGDRHAVRFPRAMLDDAYEFSFSGLKTAVITYVRDHPNVPVADIAASFQDAVVDVLVTKLLRAALDAGVETVAIGGGVAANSQLRSEVAARAEAAGLRAFVPARAWCTDNAAMIGAAGLMRLAHDGPSPLDAPSHPSLRLPLMEQEPGRSAASH